MGLELTLPDVLGLITTGDRPLDFEAPEFTRWFFTIWASVGAILVLPWAIRKVRQGAPWLLLMVVGGFLSSFLEPMLDTLLHLWYPTNLPFGFYEAFGIHIPALVPPAYVFFGGVTSYGAYLLIQRGMTLRQFFLLDAAMLVSDLTLEYPGILTDAYVYYGDQPFSLGGFPWWVAIPASSATMIMAFMLWWAANNLEGRQRLLAVFIPPVGIGFSYGAVAWPGILGVNASLPDAVTWLMAAACVIPAILITYVIGTIAGVDRSSSSG